jgi:hypothetical protein
LLIGSVAFGGTARPVPVTTTQRAVVDAQAFKSDDPIMKSPQVAKALSPTMVSATFTNIPAMQAFAELSKQSGYAIELYNSGGGNQTRFGNVTATITNQPFWAAMREVCTRGNVALYYYGDDDPDKIQLMPSNYGQQHMMKAAASIKGPYLTVVTSLQRTNSVAMGAPQTTNRSVNLQIHTFAEPKARPTQYAYEPVIDEAVDDNGNSMLQTDNNRQPNMQSNRGVSWYGYVRLAYPTTNPGKKIARVRGHIDAKVQLQSEPWEIADPLKAPTATKTIGGKKITFKSFKKNDTGRYTLELVFARGDMDPQTFQQTAFNNEPGLKLTDSGGRYQAYSSGGSSSQDEATRQFSFARRARAPAAGPPPDPDKLIIEIPTATQDVAIPFELVDLPMP